MVQVRQEHFVGSRIDNAKIPCSGLVPGYVFIDSQEQNVKVYVVGIDTGVGEPSYTITNCTRSSMSRE